MKSVISVIITSFNEEDNIVACLESLLRQKTDIPFEIILVDSSEDSTSQIVSEKYPSVRLFSCQERKYCGDGRNLGFSRAEGEIVAFLDADCTAADDWVEQIYFAHQDPHPTVGGSIDNGNRESLVSWSAYFCEYSRYMPGTPSSLLQEMPGANASFKRELLQQFGPFIEGTYGSDSEIYNRLRKAGIRVRFVPEIKIVHRSITNLERFLKHEFVHGRSYADVRVRFLDFSGWRRVVYACFFYLIPLKLFLEIFIRVLKNRIYLKEFTKAIPLTIPGLFAWSLGELSSYLGVQSND